MKAADNNGLAKPGVAYTAATAAANNNATPDFSAADLAAGAKARTAAEKKRKTAGSPTAAETEAEAEDAAYLKAVLNSLALRQKAADANFGAEADFVVTMSGEDAGVSYSAGLTIDKTDGPAIGALTLASSGFSITYHKDNLSAITTTGADGEDDNIGDLKIAYAGNGLTADYTVDTDNDDNPYVANFGYEIAGFTVGVKVDDSTDGNKTGFRVRWLPLVFDCKIITFKAVQKRVFLTKLYGTCECETKEPHNWQHNFQEIHFIAKANGAADKQSSFPELFMDHPKAIIRRLHKMQ